MASINNQSQCLTVQTPGLPSPRDNNNSGSRGTVLSGSASSSMGPCSPQDRLSSAVIVTIVSPTGDGKVVKLERRSVRDYRSQDEYMLTMKEDLSEWFNILYQLSTTADDLLDQLKSGILLCQLAEQVQQYINRSQGHCEDVSASSPPASISSPRGPAGSPPWTCTLSTTAVHRAGIQPGGTSFHSRDNLCQFLSWCRQALCIPDTLLFETDDLVLRKNERSVVLCLLEVARQGVKFGFPAPMLVQLEQEIDAELAGEQQQQQQQEEPAQVVASVPGSGGSGGSVQVSTDCSTSDVNITQRQRSVNNLMSLDERVRDILGRCTCPVQFSMIRVSEGRYKIGDYQTMIFIRILRSHVMVRIGGGWDTLENFLDRHDPCRCQLKAHKTLSSWTSALSYPAVGRQQQQLQASHQSASISSSDDDQTSLKIDLSSLHVDSTVSDSCQPSVNPSDTSYHNAVNSQSVSVSDTLRSKTPISLSAGQQKVASMKSSVTVPSLITSGVSSSVTVPSLITSGVSSSVTVPSLVTSGVSSVTVPSVVTSGVSSSVLMSSVTSPSLMSSRPTVSKHLSNNSRLKFPSSGDIRSTQLSSPRQTGNGIRSSVDSVGIVHKSADRRSAQCSAVEQQGSATDRGRAAVRHNATGRSSLTDRSSATERGRSTDRNVSAAAGRLPRAQSLGPQSSRQSTQQTTQRPSTPTLKSQSTGVKVSMQEERNPTVLFISRNSSGKHVVTGHTSSQQTQLVPRHNNTQHQQQQQLRGNERMKPRERSASRDSTTSQQQQQNRARSPEQRSAEQKQQQRVRSTSRDRTVHDCESRERSKRRETITQQQQQAVQSPRQQQTSVNTSRKLLTSGRMSLTAGQLLPNKLKVQRSVTVDNSQAVDTVVNNVNRVLTEPRRTLSMTDALSMAGTSSDFTDSQQVSNINFTDTSITSDTQRSVIQLLPDVSLLSQESVQDSSGCKMPDSALAAVSCANLNTNSPKLDVAAGNTVDVICTSPLPSVLQNADCTSPLPSTSTKSDGIKNSSSCDTFRNLLDTLPDLPPPADNEELNTRMELLFEEYRKVELGLIGQELKPGSGNEATTDSRKTTDELRNGGSREAAANGRSRGRSLSRDQLSSSRMVVPNGKKLDPRNITNGQVTHLSSSGTVTGNPVITRPSGRVASASVERSRAPNNIPAALTPRTSTHRSASLQRINTSRSSGDKDGKADRGKPGPGTNAVDAIVRKDDGTTASGKTVDKKCVVANGRKENIASTAGRSHNNKATGNQQSKDSNKPSITNSCQHQHPIVNIAATTTTTTTTKAVNEEPLVNITNSASVNGLSEYNLMANGCQKISDCDVLLGKVMATTKDVNRRWSTGDMEKRWRKDKYDNKRPTKIPLPVEMKRKSSLKRVDSGVDINNIVNMSTNDCINV